jgi:TrmH family RNA methyltransferase
MMRDVPSTLASPSNPRIKSVVRLRDRRERDATGLTLVDGAREARRALASDIEVVEAFVCESLLAGEDARVAFDRLHERDLPITTTTETAFAKIAFGERAEGVLLVVRVPTLRLEDLKLRAEPLIVVVEGVEKPGNLGAILRSADGAGADALIAASPRTDLFNPNVLRASAGTAFAVPMAAAPTSEVIEWLALHHLRIVAARVDAPTSYTDSDLTGPLAIALGSEADGLTDVWRGATVEPVRVPMAGIADSLNVSVTAAVLLYEARRQRDRHVEPPD